MPLMSWFLNNWGEVELPRPASLSVATIGSKLRIFPSSTNVKLPSGLEITTSDDGSNWGSWTGVEWRTVMAVPFPGYFKLRGAEATTVKWYNYKSFFEATSLTGVTVCVGELEVAPS